MEATMIGARDSIWAAGQDPKSTDTQEDVDKISDQRIKSNAEVFSAHDSKTKPCTHRRSTNKK